MCLPQLRRLDARPIFLVRDSERLKYKMMWTGEKIEEGNNI